MKRQNKKKDCREWHRDKESQNIKINTFENVVRNLQVDQNKIIETIANAAKLKVRILIKIKSIVSCFYLVNIIYNKTNQRQYLFSSFGFFLAIFSTIQKHDIFLLIFIENTICIQLTSIKCC